MFAIAKPTLIEVEYPTPYGTRQYQIKMVPEFDLQGQVKTVLTIARDITELKAVELALRRSEEKFRKVFETSPIAIGLTNLDTLKFTQVNPAYCQLLGYTEAEMLSLSFTDFSEVNTLQINFDYLKQLVAGEISSFQLDKRYIRKDGNPIWVSFTVALLADPTEGVNYGVAMVENITKRKQAEASLRASLQEKEVLLKEVHHRVKNNLQIVSSLLRMQSRAVSDATTAMLFQDAQDRVQSMALMHEHLYQSSNLSQVNFEEYIRVLLNHLFRSYGVNSQQITNDIYVQATNLTLDLAIPCGLIINELVSNSLKHAFPGDRAGSITIRLLSPEQTNVSTTSLGTLIVQDNGIGIPLEVDWQTTSSLGLRIVRNLVEQMRGVLTVGCDRGTVFQIAFPRPHDSAPSQIG
ncbi:MAG: PAS domain S-box protein [Oscillatoriales cyanobacterium C42_A2020_001]|nr:PAS domain S-box protein [Leptolyngbyaceae cyanobacterium C42_A2020_001]